MNAEVALIQGVAAVVALSLLGIAWWMAIRWGDQAKALNSMTF